MFAKFVIKYLKFIEVQCCRGLETKCEHFVLLMYLVGLVNNSVPVHMTYRTMKF